MMTNEETVRELKAMVKRDETELTVLVSSHLLIQSQKIHVLEREVKELKNYIKELEK